MGAWSTGSFGNDDALDFVDGLTSFDMVTSLIASLAGRKGNLETKEACCALAACDLMATGLGRPPGDLPDLPDITLRGVSDDALKTARAVVARVRDASELAELWDDTEDEGEEWRSEIEALLVRLTPSLPYEAPAPSTEPDKPDDFIGYCLICYGMVTERNGLRFEYSEGGSTMAIYPHRRCIEERVPGSGPYWYEDGSPTPPMRRQLMLALGFEDSDLTEAGQVRTTASDS